MGYGKPYGGVRRGSSVSITITQKATGDGGNTVDGKVVILPGSGFLQYLFLDYSEKCFNLKNLIITGAGLNDDDFKYIGTKFDNYWEICF